MVVAVVPTHVPQPWPLDSQWLALTGLDWAPLRAPSKDVTPSYVDVTSAGRTRTVGPYPSGYVFMREEPRTLYFRLLLGGNPITGNRFQTVHWGALFDLDGDGLFEWGASVLGIPATAQTVRVAYAPLDRPGRLLEVVTWSVPAAPAAGWTRVVAGPRAEDGSATYYLDWQVPLAVLSADVDGERPTGAPPPVEPRSCPRILLATGTSAARLNKDSVTGPAVTFAPVAALCLDGLPFGRRGRLADTRDPDPPSRLGEWPVGDTVTVQGRWWPTGAADLTVRVTDPLGVEVHRGTVPVTGGGVVPPTPLWTVPSLTLLGVFGLEVLPPGGTSFVRYDCFTVPRSGPSVTLLRPAGGELWTGTETVSWSGSSPNGYPLTYDLLYSTDGGLTYGYLARGLDGTSFVWDTSTYPSSSSYRLRVVASDGFETGQSTSGQFTVDNTPPTVAFVSPAEGDVLSGTVVVEVHALDLVGLARVEVYAGATLLGVFTSPPYTLLWDTTAFANGPTVLRAMATDLVGLQAETTLGVEVRNIGRVVGQALDATTGAGIPGAVVRLLLPPGLVQAETVAGPDGTFSFADVPTGAYIVTAQAPGYAAASLGAVVTAGAAATVDLELAPEPSAVVGVVTDASTGLPLVGATVRVDRAGIPQGEATTGAGGAYVVGGLAQGTQVVTASFVGYQTALVGVTLLPGQTATADLALEPTPAVIEGRVTESLAGLPLVGATVVLLAAGAVIRDQTITDAAGEYSFAGVPPGAWTLTASRPGYAAVVRGANPGPGETVVVNFVLEPLPGRVGGTVTDTRTGLALGGVLVRALGPDGGLLGTFETDPDGRYLLEGLPSGALTLVFSFAGYRTAVLGTVLDPGGSAVVDAALEPFPAAVEGTVSSAATGLPLAGAEVALYDAAGVRLGATPTAPDGGYRFDGLAPGAYSVTVTLAGYAQATVGVHPGPGETVTADLALEPNPGAVRGTVTDATTGLALAGVTVRLVTAAGVPVGVAVTDPAGLFLFEGLEPAPGYVLLVSLSGYARAEVGVEVLPGATTSVALGLVPLPSEVGGRVTSAATGEPLVGAAVRVLDRAGLAVGTAVTGPDGRYSVSGLAAATYTVVGTALGYQGGEVGLILGPGESGMADLALAPLPATVRGLVTDSVGGLPLAGVTVRIVDEAGLPVAVVLSGPDGRWEAAGLAAGSLRVVLLLAGYGQEEVGVVVGPGTTAEVSVSLTPSYGTLTVAVSDEGTGLPLAGAVVVVLDDSGLEVAAGVADPAGLVSFRPAPGRYVVRVLAAGYSLVSVGAEVLAGLETTVSLALAALPGIISGRVVAADSALPLPGATVRFYGSTGLPAGTVLTDPSGLFESGELSADSYLLVATAPGYAESPVSVAVGRGETVRTEVALVPLPGTVRGTVTDLPTGIGLAGAAVAVTRPGGAPVTTVLTDPDGGYEVRGLAVGSYVLSFRAAEHQSVTQAVEVTQPGEVLTVDAALPLLPAAVSGTVTDAATGVPLAGATVTVQSPDGTFLGSTVTDPAGAYSVGDLWAGTLTVTASLEGYARRSGTASPGPGETSVLDLALNSLTGALAGRLTDAVTGAPVVGATVLVRTVDGLPLAATVSGRDGTFLVPGLPVGDVLVFAPATLLYQEFLGGAVIPSGATVYLDVALRRVEVARPWPADTGWVAVQDPACRVVRSVSAEVSPAWLDLTSAGSPGARGPHPTCFVALRPETGALYFRVLLGALPLGLGGLLPGRWGVLLDADGDGCADWGALVTGLDAGGPRVRVKYCPAGVCDQVVRVETWSAPAESAAGFVRVVSGPLTPEGRETFYLDWQVPLEAFRSAGPGTPPSLGDKSCVRFFAATGDLPERPDGGEVFNVDYLEDRAVDFDLVRGVCLDGLPWGRLGRLYDVRDPDPPSDLGEWAPGETVVVTGRFFCAGTTVLSVRVRDARSAEVWRGTVPVLGGDVPPAATWTVPEGTAPGLFYLEASDRPDDPAPPAGWLVYDRFTVPHLPPVVDLLAPRGGELWTGTNTVSWTASSPQGFALVFDLEASPDGGATWLPVATGVTGLSYAWDTSGFPDSASYLFRVTARDGTTSASAVSPGTFTVDNSPPTVAVTAPAPGSVVSGLVEVIAEAADNVGVAEVGLWAGRRFLGTVAAPPYSTLWDTTLEPNGPVAVRAVAVNVVGLPAEASVTVEVLNLGTVSGRVTDVSTGAPLAGASVDLLLGPLTPVARTTTATDGTYSFPDRPVGQYLVTASAAGYGTGAVGVVVPAQGTGRADLALRPEPAGLSGTVLAGDTGTGLAGATVRLILNGVLVAESVTGPDGSYTVTGLAQGIYVVQVAHPSYQAQAVGLDLGPGQVARLDLTLVPNPAAVMGTVGLVTAAGGVGAPEPAAGAVVTLLGTGGIILDQTLTDAGGAYAFRGLAVASYTVSAVARGYGVQTKGAAPGPGETVTVDFILEALPGRLVGRVTDALTGVPLGGAAVTVLDSRPGGAATRVLTAPDGSYVVEGLAAGSYQVLFSAAGHRDVLLGATVPPGATGFLDAELELLPAGIVGMVSATGHPAPVFLTMSFADPAAPAPEVGAQAAIPVPGARVDVLLNGVVLVAGAVTDMAGAYMVAGLSPLTYTLVFRAQGYATATRGVMLMPGETATVDVVLSVLPGAVRGLVTDADTGLPLAGVSARLADVADVPVAQALTDEAGIFRMEGVAPALAYRLDLTLPGYGGLTLDVAVAPGETTEVTASLVALSGSVRGLVTSQLDGHPLPGTAVRVLDAGAVTVAGVTTGPDGRYYIPNLRPGTYVVNFHADGYANRHTGVVIGAGEDVVQDMALEPLPGRVYGVVTGAETGEPLGGVEVNLYETAGVVYTSAVTGSDGSYNLADIRPGAYTVTFILPGYTTLQVGVPLGPGEAVRVDVALSRAAGRAVFVVTDADSGLPLVGATVTITSGRGLAVITLFTGDDGTAATEVAPGLYTATVDALLYAQFQTALEVRPEATTVVPVALSRLAGFIEGFVFDTDTGRPIFDAHVGVYSSLGVPVGVYHTDTNGVFFVPGLRPDTYLITVETEVAYGGGATSVTVGPGEMVRTRIGLTPLPGTVRGVVTDRLTGKPIAGAGVQSFRQGDIPEADRLTGVDGRFSIASLSVGEHALSVRAPVYASQDLGFFIAAPGEIVTVDVALVPTPAVLDGTVRDADTGLPLQQAAVSVLGPAGIVVAVVLGDIEGRYQASGLRPGPYILTADAPGYGRQSLGAVLRSGETTTVDFSLKALGGAVAGRVTDATTGEPLGEVVVAVYGETGADGGAMVTAADGSYLVPKLPAGRVWVSFRPPFGYQGAGAWAVIENGRTTVLDARLESEPGRVVGRVVEAKRPRGVPGAAVAVLTTDGLPVRAVLADQRGAFRLGGLAPGRYLVVASADGFGAASLEVTVRSGKTTLVELRLVSRPGWVTGAVTDAETGLPLAGVGVRVVAPDGRWVALALTDDKGVYRTPELAPGMWDVSFFLPGYALEARRVDVSSAEGSVLDVALRPGAGRVTGTVRAADSGAPLEAAIVVRDAAGVVLALGRSGADGTYSIDHLRGPVTLEFAAPGYLPGRWAVTVPVGEEVGLDVTLEPLRAAKARSARVTVASVSGEVLASRLVLVRGELNLDLVYVPVGADEVAFLERVEPFSVTLRVGPAEPGDEVEVKASVLRTEAKARRDGTIRVAVLLGLTVTVDDRPPREEKRVVLVTVDPHEVDE
ncbi:MAG: carboxypeptidase regulatory-like domain-containing protein [Firmicutes bacterium]|nr:carboxypeptidase regulatory-like domain-containing protein [Bacillota bacterium]